MKEYTTKRGYDVRFWNETPFVADIVLYDDKIGMTAYGDALITTVITNKVIADTFRVIFEGTWEAATQVSEN